MVFFSVKRKVIFNNYTTAQKPLNDAVKSLYSFSMIFIIQNLFHVDGFDKKPESINHKIIQLNIFNHLV